MTIEKIKTVKIDNIILKINEVDKTSLTLFEAENSLISTLSNPNATTPIIREAMVCAKEKTPNSYTVNFCETYENRQNTTVSLIIFSDKTQNEFARYFFIIVYL
jgi:hypothetical protein